MSVGQQCSFVMPLTGISMCLNHLWPVSFFQNQQWSTFAMPLKLLLEVNQCPCHSRVTRHECNTPTVMLRANDVCFQFYVDLTFFCIKVRWLDNNLYMSLIQCQFDLLFQVMPPLSTNSQNKQGWRKFCLSLSKLILRWQKISACQHKVRALRLMENTQLSVTFWTCTSHMEATCWFRCKGYFS